MDFKLIQVKTFDFQASILAKCTERNDEWAQKVKARIDFVIDLHAADAVYHKACSNNFRNQKQIPQKYLPSDSRSAKHIKLGRPQDEVQAEAFAKVIEYLEENDEEQTTIHDLIKLMGDYLVDTDAQPYSFPHMKQQIQKQFGDKIIITEVNGKSNVVTF